MVNPFIEIEGIKIGENYPPLIIPEIGINHGGKLETAIKMVDSAKKAGAKIIKHQTHIPDDEMSEEAKKVKPGNSSSDIYSIINKFSILLTIADGKNNEISGTKTEVKDINNGTYIFEFIEDEITPPPNSSVKSAFMIKSVRGAVEVKFDKSSSL